MKHITLLTILMMATSAFAAKDNSSILSEQQKVLAAAKVQINATTKSLTEAKQTIKEQKAYIESLKKEIIVVINERNSALDKVDALQQKVDKLEKKVLQTGRERDVFIVAFTIMGVITAFGFIRPFLALIPPPYSYAAYIATPIALFFGIFYAARLALQLLVKLIF